MQQDEGQGMGVSADADRATRASTEPASGLGPDGRISTDAERDRKGRFKRRLRLTPDDTREWLIWSREWRMWHRRSSCGGACGYTDDIAEAGLFPRPKAAAYHDGIKDEAFHVSEKMHLIRAAIAEHDAKLVLPHAATGAA